MNNTLKEKYNDIKIGSKRIYYKVLLCAKNDELDMIATLLDSGVDIIELSGKNVSSSYFFNIAKKVKLLCAHYDATLIIDERVDIAFLTDADGVFLSEADIDIESAKKILGQNALVGTSVITNSKADFYLTDLLNANDNTYTFVCAGNDIESCKNLIEAGATKLLVSDLIPLSEKKSKQTIQQIRGLLTK